MNTSTKTISAATLFLLFALMAQLTVNGQETFELRERRRKEEEAEKAAQIKSAVDSIGKVVSAKRILFKPNWISTETSGFVIDSTLGYYVKISGDTVKVFLPTYNKPLEIAVTKGPSTINTKQNLEFQYSKCQMQVILIKNQWIYTITFADKGDRVDVNFHPDGRTSVSVMRAYKGWNYSGVSYLF